MSDVAPHLEPTPEEPPQHQPPQPVLAYATPLAHQGAGVWREGSKLVVTKEIHLPDRCVKCNAPAEGWTIRKTLYWHSPLLYILIFFPGILIYAIVAMVVRQNAKVTAALCPVHRRKRWTTILIAWLAALLGVATVVAGMVLAGDRDTEAIGLVSVLVGFLMIVGGGIYGAIWSAVLSPTKMNGNYAWLKGAGNDYLATFPPTGW